VSGITGKTLAEYAKSNQKWKTYYYDGETKTDVATVPTIMSSDDLSVLGITLAISDYEKNKNKTKNKKQN
jgi:hypothetical protein